MTPPMFGQFPRLEHNCDMPLRLDTFQQSRSASFGGAAKPQ